MRRACRLTVGLVCSDFRFDASGFDVAMHLFALYEDPAATLVAGYLAASHKLAVRRRWQRGVVLVVVPGVAAERLELVGNVVGELMEQVAKAAHDVTLMSTLPTLTNIATRLRSSSLSSL